MKVGYWLDTEVAHLADTNTGTARLDCLVLLEDALGKERTHLLANPEIELTDEQINVLDSQIARRAKLEPLAYIRGKTEFYGREFIVNSHTLEPRPETETMIDLLKSLSPFSEDDPHKPQKHVVIDIGTGSGAIGVTAAIELPNYKVIVTDIDPQCLKVAKQNAAKHNIQLEFLQGDLLAPVSALTPSPFALLCNLPYVPDDYQINEAAKHEPELALFGGSDGLDLYRRLFQQISETKQKPHFILTESLPFQHNTLASIASPDYRLVNVSDFIQLFERHEAHVLQN